jgi:hypothetical protein
MRSAQLAPRTAREPAPQCCFCAGASRPAHQRATREAGAPLPFGRGETRAVARRVLKIEHDQRAPARDGMLLGLLAAIPLLSWPVKHRL